MIDDGTNQNMSDHYQSKMISQKTVQEYTNWDIFIIPLWDNSIKRWFCEIETFKGNAWYFTT